MTGTTEKTVMHQHRTPIGFWYALTMVFVSMFGAVVFSVVYSNHAAMVAAHRSDVKAAQAVQDSEQAMCDLLMPIDGRYHKLPQPQTKDVNDFVASLDRLVTKYHCKAS